MVREDMRGPRYRNSWHPGEGPTIQHTDRGKRARSPESPVRTGPSSSTWTPRPSARVFPDYNERPASAQPFKNPNLIPVVPRRSHAMETFSPTVGSQQDREVDEERLPQIWHPSIDDLVRRTAHDYDMIMNYERDAEGGQRWLPEDIERIRVVGKNLHRDIFNLRRWPRVVAQHGDQDKHMMIQIKRDANLLKLLCERVQMAIVKYEQKCEFELLRDGVYAQDEDGNFYKPMALHQHVAESGYQQYVPHPSTEYYELKRKGESYSNISRLRAPPNDVNCLQPKGSLDFDGTTHTATSKDEAVYPEPEATRQPVLRYSGRAPGGGSPKYYLDSPPTHHRRSPSPTPSCEPPNSNVPPVRTTSDTKLRGRVRSNKYERDGKSRRQAKMDKARERSPRPAAGHLGKHKLYY
ncbi:hypothetical protein OPT61_g5958 [Boeremia exigua]|uniref:Uncharacterized protein n=1 Tax=Boeremia exigua TaxID=749465 RepID=A0ACC2I8E0_9PLEO|nr:hypothetical protein OPT61_g5958 [Boeremia exigua]